MKDRVDQGKRNILSTTECLVELKYLRRDLIFNFQVFFFNRQKAYMSGWPHQLNRQEFEQTLGDGEGQGSLGCCGPWGHKETHTRSHWTMYARIPLFKGLFWYPYFFLPNTVYFVWQNTSLYSMTFMVSALYLWPEYFFTSTIQTRPSTSLWGRTVWSFCLSLGTTLQKKVGSRPFLWPTLWQ